MVNYFEILGLEEVYDLSLKVLDDAYFKMQMQYHPDRFAMKTEEERYAAAAQSELINAAYQVLKKPFTRAQHLVSLYVEIDNKPLDDVDLMERIFEWHEELAVDREETLKEIFAFQSELEAELRALIASQDYKSAAEVIKKMKFVNSALEN